MAYQCACGRIFDNSQSLNGHKSHCAVHLAQTGRKRTVLSIADLNRLRAIAKAERERQVEQRWLEEQHRCECCGVVMVQKYGSGRFCSKACANTHVRTDASKQKTSKSLKQYYHNVKHDKTRIQEIRQQHPQATLTKSAKIRQAYAENPRLCAICNKPISFERREHATCSEQCYRQLLSQVMKKRVAEAGGNLNPFGPGASKYGTYRGYPCDSSWELAFLMYHLDNHIPIQRNHESFEYTYQGSLHKYYPDFIVQNEYIEIKNYDSERNQAKRAQFPSDKTLKTLFKNDMRPYLQYCVDMYGKDFYTLYDKDKPSWMDKQMKV